MPETIGSGQAFGIDAEVRPVEGFRSDLIAAISIPGGYCSETDPDEVHTPWSLAFASDADIATVGAATCKVGALSPAQAAADGCKPDAGPDPSDDRSPEDADIAAIFVERLAAGSYGDAAEMWSGYPYREDEKLALLQDFVEENDWLVDNRVVLDVVDAFSLAQFEAMKVVSITDADRRGTTAVLLDGAGVIQRIQLRADLVDSPVVKRDEVVLPGMPVEGSAVAYLDSSPIPSDQIEVDWTADSTLISIPEGSSSEGPRLLVVSMATPELPTALALLIDQD